MWTMRKNHLMYVYAFALLLSFAPTVWAENLTISGLGSVVNNCEWENEGTPQAGELILAADAPVRRTAHTLEITSIDARGKVTARSLVTREVVTFNAEPATLKRKKLVRGSRIAAGSIAGISVDRICACGKKQDTGECWCVSSEPACCGPLAGCPMGSCDKKGPVNPEDKPVFEQSPGSQPAK